MHFSINYKKKTWQSLPLLGKTCATTQKRKESCFLKSEKNIKYVFSNTEVCNAKSTHFTHLPNIYVDINIAIFCKYRIDIVSKSKKMISKQH